MTSQWWRCWWRRKRKAAWVTHPPTHTHIHTHTPPSPQSEGFAAAAGLHSARTRKFLAAADGTLTRSPPEDMRERASRRVWWSSWSKFTWNLNKKTVWRLLRTPVRDGYSQVNAVVALQRRSVSQIFNTCTLDKCSQGGRQVGKNVILLMIKALMTVLMVVVV